MKMTTLWVAVSFRQNLKIESARLKTVVFNLYPVTETLFLPAANIVDSDADGALTYIVQKAIPATLPSYGIELTPQLQRLLQAIDRLSPKNLEDKFKPARAKTATPLKQLLSDAATKSTVEGYIYRELDSFLSDIVRYRLPLSLDAERKSLVKDVQIRFTDEEVLPHLSFDRHDNGVDYRLQLGTESEKWNIREFDAFPLTNTEPAWVVARYVLCRVPGINGNMIRPFRQKDLIQIPPDKVHLYFRQFIVKNAGRTRIEANGFDIQKTDTLLRTQLDVAENILEKNWFLKPVFCYQGAAFFWGEKRDKVTSVVFSDPSDQADILVKQVCRDTLLERARIDALLGRGLVQDGAQFKLPPTGPDRLKSLEALVRFLAEHRHSLETEGFDIVLPVENGRTIALETHSLSIRSEMQGDWFDVHGRFQVGDKQYPIAGLMPYIRRRDPFFPLGDGTYFIIPEEWMARYADLAQAVQADGERLRLPKALFTLVGEAGLSEGVAAAEMPVIDPDLIDYQPGSDLKADLRPYQLRGVKWLIGHYRHGFGACLADDMGLGKTLQTIAALLYAKTARAAEDNTRNGGSPSTQLDLFQTYQETMQPLNALVVLPASLVFNWQKELAKFAPSLFVYVHTGAKRLKDARAMAGYDVVLTTYHTARQDLALLEKISWHYMVLDESQQIKNRDSEVSKVVRSLEARNKVSLSGTPIENSLADLWTQMEFINPDTLGSYKVFREQFQVPIEKQQDEQARKRLFARVKPFFMRRTKEEVAPDLPELSDQVFYTEMEAEQRKRYEQLKSAVRNEILSLFDDPKTRLQALAALTRLRQLANHPLLTDAEYSGGSGKLNDVLAQWDTIRRAGHKVLIFSSFEQHLLIFRRLFEKEKYPFAWLSGATPAPERAREVQRFQDDPAVQAFFMTIKAGGVGLNLTAADYVFILDPWWNPAVEDQAVARAHRIGQTRPVNALRFISKDTIEEKIRELQERKKALGKELFAEQGEVPAMTREDLEMLLG
jgi:hypothetical protein